MKKIVLVLFFLGWIIQSYAQSEPDAKIMDIFRNAIDNLESSIPPQGDVYGFGIGIKVAYKPSGGEILELYPNLKHTALLKQAQVFASNERFDRFNLNIDPNIVRKKGIFLYQAGAYPQLNLLENTDKPNEWETLANEYSEKVLIDGKLTSLIIHIYAICLVQKPNNGSLGADVYFYDKDGKPKLWQSWGAKSPKIAYTRMGPGNEEHNSKVGENEFRMINGTFVGIGDFFTPGHYLPVITFRGCTQDFRNEDDTHSKRIENVLKLDKGQIDWSDIRNYTFDGKTAFTGLKVVQEEKKDFLTYFSKGNIIEGQVKNEEKRNVEAVFDIVLKPTFSPAPFTQKKVKSDKNGYYRFDNIESGTYKVYVDGYEDKSKKIEVCNCPQKGETYNYTYIQDINLSTGYDIYAHYHSDYLADAKVVWRNVKIVIPDDRFNIKTYNSSDFKGSDDEIFKQMKALEIPYALNIPGYGKEYFFSQCQDEYETPEEVSMKLLPPGDDGVCFIQKDWDALNSFSIEMTSEDPNVLKVNLQFDMFVGESREKSIQMTVGTDTEINGGTDFVWKKLDEDIVKKIQAGEYAQKVLTNNGGCTLTVTFQPN